MSMRSGSICVRCSLFCCCIRLLRSRSDTELIVPCRATSAFSSISSRQCSSELKDASKMSL